MVYECVTSALFKHFFYSLVLGFSALLLDEGEIDPNPFFFFFVSILPGSRCAEDDFWTVHWRAALFPLLGAAPGCAADHSSLGHLHQW